MPIRTFLTSTINLSHLFMLDDASRDPGSNGLATTGGISVGSFVNDPVCNGVNNSFRSNSSGTSTGVNTGFVVNNTADTNNGTGIWQRYSVILWFKTEENSTPTCVYEQGGGGTNNHAIIVGLGKAITSQAADSGEPFLIAQSKFQAEVNRPYFVTHVWERHTEHAGNNNRVLLYVNGVFQESFELNGTDPFPSHGGNISIGNTADALQSYNGSTLVLTARRKWINMFGILSGGSITENQSREIFERSVLPEITIPADTVANQQILLDSLSGNSYSNTNLAIRIIQATDATDYRLFIDNISFQEDSNLRDIAIQYVGPNNLTIENANSSNVVEISTPAEIDIDGSTIFPGGGNIILINDVIRLNTVTDQSNINANKIVIENAGTYNFTNVIINELENNSNGIVNITTDNGISIITNTGGGSVTTVLDSYLTFEDIDSWEVYSDMNRTILLESGTGTYNFTYVASTTYYLKVSSGGIFFNVASTPASTGETKVTLNSIALILALQNKMDSDHAEIKVYSKKAGDNSEELNQKF